MLIARPYSLPFPTLFSNSLLLRTSTLSRLSASTSAVATSTCTAPLLPSPTSTLNPNPNPHFNGSYGPSLHKGTPPPRPQPHPQFRLAESFNHAKQQTLEEEGGGGGGGGGAYEFDESAFTRVFDIAAIRVPSGECASLESRLRGHLLNWPRIRNIARVPGDEVEEELAILLGKTGIDCGDGDGDASFMVSLNRRVRGKGEGDGDRLSPVLYRDKLVKTFNSRGFEKFRNLAKMSRPRQKKKKRRKEGESGGGPKGKNEFAMVEVVEDEEQGEDLSGLLGEEFKGRRWRGSTRLLLLDEKYADRGVDGLPEAIKVAVPIL